MKVQSFVFVLTFIILAPTFPVQTTTNPKNYIYTTPIMPEPDSTPPIYTPQLTTVTFPANCFLIPMDNHQADVIKAFGLVHALLRNNTMICRIIEPLPPPAQPNITIKTLTYPNGDNYSGGPILVHYIYQNSVNSLMSTYPTVTVDRTTEQFTNDRVYVVMVPTKILVIYGIWGLTHHLLSDMRIPYTMVDTSDIEANPSMLLDYDLVVVDCPGWNSFYAGTLPSKVAVQMRKLVENAGEIIFTDIALGDMDEAFPNYVTTIQNVDGTYSMNMHEIPEFPGQYAGPPKVPLYTMISGVIMSAVNNSQNVRIMVDCNNYGGAGNYRIAACYFYYGSGADKGIVEGFAYHPGEQTVGQTGNPNSYKLASFLYGNKFIHSISTDSSINSFCSYTPSSIARYGTGKNSSEEQATIKLSIKAMGDSVRPINVLQLNYELMPYINNVTGTFVDDLGHPRNPDSITVQTNLSKNLVWNIPWISVDRFWNVSFKVTSLKEGNKVYVNAYGKSNISYMSSMAMIQRPAFQNIYLNVYDGTKVLELFFVYLPAFALIVITASRVKRKKYKNTKF